MWVWRHRWTSCLQAERNRGHWDKRVEGWHAPIMAAPAVQLRNDTCTEKQGISTTGVEGTSARETIQISGEELQKRVVAIETNIKVHQCQLHRTQLMKQNKST